MIVKEGFLLLTHVAILSETVVRFHQAALHAMAGLHEARNMNGEHKKLMKLMMVSGTLFGGLLRPSKGPRLSYFS